MLALRSVLSLAPSRVFATAWCMSLPFLAAGCNTVLWGNVGVFCVTVGIFLGTVFLSRSRPAQSSAASSSSSSSPSPTSRS